MTIKLGCNPLCWMNTDFPELKEQATVHECLSDIALIGYQGVEMEDPFLKVQDELRIWLQEMHLVCIGKWHSTHLLENSIEEELTRIESHCDMLASLGAYIVNLAECTRAVHQCKTTSLLERPLIQNEKEWIRLCNGLDALAGRIADRKMISAYHHHMGTVIQTQEEIDRLMQGTHKLGLLLDTGHLLYAQADPSTILEKHLSRITHVHCKSIRPDVLTRHLHYQSSFFDAVMDGIFTVPGDQGDIVDYQAMIEALSTTNYDGWVVVEAEQDPSQADPFTYAQLGYDTLSSLLNINLYQYHNKNS